MLLKSTYNTILIEPYLQLLQLNGKIFFKNLELKFNKIFHSVILDIKNNQAYIVVHLRSQNCERHKKLF